jgi:ligand-binding sensor domain-containing protein
VLNPNGQWITYDEKSKTVYEHYSSSALVIDRYDRIWVANNDGLRVFLPDGTKIVYTKENSGLPDDYITALAEDSHGNIWIGTRTGGIVVFDQDGRWRIYQANGTTNGLIENWVTAILLDDQDRVWIGTERRGISMLSPDNKWTTYDVPQWGVQSNPEYYDQQINALAMDEKGWLWIGTGDGLFALEPDDSWIAYTKANSGFNPDWVRALTTDGSGRLWIATFQEVIVFDSKNGLPEIVPAEWLRLRTILLIPMKMISALKTLIALVFLPVTIPILNIVYIVLLISLPFSVVGLSKSNKKDNPSLFYTSAVAFVLSIIGAPLLWILSLFLLMALRD